MDTRDKGPGHGLVQSLRGQPPPHLAGALGRLTPDNAQGEYYLTDVPRLLLADGLRVEAFMTTDEGSALGVNNPLELAEAEARELPGGRQHPRLGPRPAGARNRRGIVRGAA